jgi:hypothetical protein
MLFSLANGIFTLLRYDLFGKLPNTIYVVFPLVWSHRMMFAAFC